MSKLNFEPRFVSSVLLTLEEQKSVGAVVQAALTEKPGHLVQALVTGLDIGTIAVTALPHESAPNLVNTVHIVDATGEHRGKFKQVLTIPPQ